MEIRPPNRADVASLIALVKEVYAEMPTSMWFERAPEDAELLDLFNRKLNGMAHGEMTDSVAVEGDRVVGECEIVRDTAGMGLVGIILLPEYRGRGLGRKLLNAASKDAKRIGISTLRAEVSLNNPSAVLFFQRLGFSLLGSVQGHKREGTVLLEMRV